MAELLKVGGMSPENRMPSKGRSPRMLKPGVRLHSRPRYDPYYIRALPARYPTPGEAIARRGVFRGQVELLFGRVLEVFPHRASGRRIFRWSAKVLWQDGTITHPRLSWLEFKRFGWLQLAEGRSQWTPGT
jgi:hypothetical protein